MDLSGLDNFIVERLATSMDGTDRLYHINEIYNDLSRVFTHDQVERQTMSLSALEEFVVLSWAARTIEGVEIESSGVFYPLRRVHAESIASPRSEGVPVRWAPYGIDSTLGYLRYTVDPLNSAIASASVRYEPIPASLVEYSDIPEYIPAEHHMLIAFGSLAAIAASQQDWNTAQYWDSLYRDGINNMLETGELVAPDDFPRAVIPPRREQ